MAHRCVYGTCNSNSTYSGKDYMKDVFFVGFPSRRHEAGKRQKWISFCGGNENTKSRNYYRFLCSKHFVGGQGPSEKHPDPIPLDSKSPYCKPVSARTRKAFVIPEMTPIADEIQVANDPGPVAACLPDNPNRDLVCLAQKQTVEAPLVNTTTTVTLRQLLYKVRLPPGWFIHCEGNEAAKLFRVRNYSVNLEVLFRHRADSTVGNMRLQYCVTTFGQVVDASTLRITLAADVLQVYSTAELEEFTKRLNEYNTCVGNPEAKYTSYILSNSHPSCVFRNETAAVHSRTCGKVCVGSVRCASCTMVRSSFSNIKRNSGEQLLERTKSKLKAAKLSVSALTRRLNALTKKKSEEGPFQKLLKSESLNRMYPPNTTRRLFLFQQMRALSMDNATGMRWDPAILQLLLHLKNKSLPSYKLLRKSGLISLPSVSALNRYSKNWNREPGFDAEVVNEMATDNFEGTRDQEEPHDEYVSLVVDELMINESFIYNKQTGDLIGFVHLPNETNTDICELGEHFCDGGDCSHVSEHALQVVAKGCTTGFNVLDGRLLLASNEARRLRFVSDVCSFVKTVTNGFSDGNNDSNHIGLLWSDVMKIFRGDSENVDRYLQTLTSSHGFLTPSSKTRVRLAAQALGNRVTTYLRKRGYASELVRFMEIFKKHFGVLNSRSEAFKRPPFERLSICTDSAHQPGPT